MLDVIAVGVSIVALTLFVVRNLAPTFIAWAIDWVIGRDSNA